MEFILLIKNRNRGRSVLRKGILYERIIKLETNVLKGKLTTTITR